MSVSVSATVGLAIASTASIALANTGAVGAGAVSDCCTTGAAETGWTVASSATAPTNLLAGEAVASISGSSRSSSEAPVNCPEASSQSTALGL